MTETIVAIDEGALGRQAERVRQGPETVAEAGGASKSRTRPARAAEDGRGRRNEVVLVAFTGVTNLADGIAKVALPLLAVQLTASPGLVAGVALTLTLPWLLISLPVGVLVDRRDRRRLVAGANLVRLAIMAAVLGMGTAGVLGLPALYAAGLGIGAAEVVANTAVGALVPAAIPRNRLGRANAWIAGVETLANEFCGPAVGGLLVGAGAAVALGSAAAGFAFGGVLLALLAGRFVARVDAAPAADGPAAAEVASPSSETRAGGSSSVVAEIREGLAFVWRHRLLRTMSLTIAALAACWSAWLALLPTYAADVLSLDPAGYGLLISSIGVGGLAGALAVTVVNRLLGVRWALFTDLVGTFVMMLVPAVLPVAWAVGAAAFAGGMGGTLWTVNSRTIAQTVVPGRLLGRYGAASRLLGWGTLPVAAALAGVIAEVVGTRASFAAFAVLAAATVVPFLRTVTGKELTAAGHGTAPLPAAGDRS
ncbi:MFS transporter [Sphaerisporangium fuscum]|uniref:MFS transporter n=1 Tax=Sphaerisporangium fuscum TaxID=2835868 RepID=UPI0027E32C89|nr:MFS transporter [Sphaerisporangium fuscum]